jgi:hypothetical protein
MLVAAELAGTGAFVAAQSRVSAQTDFEVVNGTANAGAAYVVFFTGKFPNFSPGVVGSSFPLAHTHIDNSPFTEATSSPADTGPAGGTAVSSYNTTPPPPPAPQTIAQPQYAESRYPGADKPSNFGSPPGPYATASAARDHAGAASGGVDTTATQNPSSSQMRSAFDSAMAQWRMRWMSPVAFMAQPAATTNATAPDGTDGDTSSSSVQLDPEKGLISVGDARVQHASFGGGALVLDGVHTTVSITNAGTPHADITTTVAGASVGGVPVTIGANGVTVGPQTVPADAVQQASAQLNAALAQAGIQVAAVAPSVMQSTSEEQVTATAVSVTVDQPSAPGAGELTVHYSLGNVYDDNLAVPSQPAVSLGGLGTFTASPALAQPQTSSVPPPPTTGVVGGPVPSPPTAAPSPTTNKPTGVAAVAYRRPKPTWLLVGYLLWQILVLATLATLWWWRRAVHTLPVRP